MIRRQDCGRCLRRVHVEVKVRREIDIAGVASARPLTVGGPRHATGSWESVCGWRVYVTAQPR